MKILVLATLLGLTLGAQPAPQAAAPAQVELWRLDCGTLVSDAAPSADGWDFVNGCYLVRHGDDYLLWDAGLPAALENASFHDGGQKLALGDSLIAQLARIGVTPDKVRYVAVSHYHGDHIGQARSFAPATLLIGAGDWNVLRTSTDARQRAGVLPWLEGQAKAEPVRGDRDVFGDGRVVLLAMPGHTPGHQALLVVLGSGPVLLSGDQYHLRAGYEANRLPGNNDLPVEAAASGDRFRALAAQRKARVIVQHDPRDVALLPIFPESAR